MIKKEYEKERVIPKHTIIKEKFYHVIPSNGKCLINKKTGHRFIHTKTHAALPLDIPANQIDLYDEVNI